MGNLRIFLRNWRSVCLSRGVSQSTGVHIDTVNHFPYSITFVTQQDCITIMVILESVVN